MAVNLFSYERGNTLLHKINALIKILFLTAFCIFIFFDPKKDYEDKRLFFILRTAVCILFPIVLFIISRRHVKIILHLWPVMLTGLFVTAFRSFDIPAFTFNKDGFYSGLLYALNFFMASLASSVIFKTTSPLQIRESLESVENILARIFPFVKKLNLALVISLTINFIPSIFEYWNKTSLACRARQADGKKKMFSIRIFNAHFTALLSCLLYRAETKRRAVLNRS